MIDRRDFLKTVTSALAGFASGTLSPGANARDPVLLQGAMEPPSASGLLASLPGKQPLIRRTYRPPNYETPVADFDSFYTANNRFFVRYHLASIPEVDRTQWRLRVGGDSVSTPIELTLQQLQREFPAVEVPALCLCAGNRRGLFEPHVPGIQWGNGAMGNASWKGVRLRDVLGKANLGQGALEVAFGGADTGVLDATPDFQKSIPLSKAMDESTLIAYEMNGEPIPHWNGFPVRLVVPGWAATYWVKHLTDIRVISQPLDNFWMKSAYRVPKGVFSSDGRFASQETETTAPVTALVVNSLIISLPDDGAIASERQTLVRGLAWDGGAGIERVEVSTDGSRTWHKAVLGQDHGRFAWRTWSYLLEVRRGASSIVMARATNLLGQTQPLEPIANPAGYHHNAAQRIRIHGV